MLILVVRTLILYGMVIAAMRIMGKRQLGELQPSELVVAIMISDLASVPMQAIDIPLFVGDYSCADFNCCGSYDVIFEP